VLAPLLAIVTCGVATILSEANRQQTFALSLEASAEAEMSALRADQARLDAKQASIAGRAAYEELLAKTPSAFLLLNELKRGIPPGVEIGKLEIAEGLVTLSAVVTDALAVIRLMNERPGWQAVALGSIASDPSTAQDVATIGVRISL
jgi:Tfp pilus assembly protein PilN